MLYTIMPQLNFFFFYLMLWLVRDSMGVVPQITKLNVQCDRAGMRVNVEFDVPFNGIIFSKGHYSDFNCRFVKQNSTQRSYEFTIPVDNCGTTSVDIGGGDAIPKKGFENVVVFQNNAIYQEEWDHARLIVCRFSLVDEKDLSDKRVLFKPVIVDMLDVITIPMIDSLGIETKVDCWMEITSGRFPNIAPIEGPIKVGSPLTLAIFIRDPRRRTDIRVKDCYAYDDPQVAENNGPPLLQLTDSEGCPIHTKLIETWKRTQDTGLTGATLIAYTTVSAFKFPDRGDLQLACNVELCRGPCTKRCSRELPDMQVIIWPPGSDIGITAPTSSASSSTTSAPDTEDDKEDEDEDKEQGKEDDKEDGEKEGEDKAVEEDKEEKEDEDKEEKEDEDKVVKEDEDKEEKEDEDKEEKEDEDKEEKEDEDKETTTAASSDSDDDSESEDDEKEEKEETTTKGSDDSDDSNDADESEEETTEKAEPKDDDEESAEGDDEDEDAEESAKLKKVLPKDDKKSENRKKTTTTAAPKTTVRSKSKAKTTPKSLDIEDDEDNEDNEDDETTTTKRPTKANKTKNKSQSSKNQKKTPSTTTTTTESTTKRSRKTTKSPSSENVRRARAPSAHDIISIQRHEEKLKEKITSTKRPSLFKAFQRFMTTFAPRQKTTSITNVITTERTPKNRKFFTKDPLSRISAQNKTENNPLLTKNVSTQLPRPQLPFRHPFIRNDRFRKLNNTRYEKPQKLQKPKVDTLPSLRRSFIESNSKNASDNLPSLRRSYIESNVKNATDYPFKSYHYQPLRIKRPTVTRRERRSVTSVDAKQVIYNAKLNFVIKVV